MNSIWIARDKEGNLMAALDKPVRDNKREEWAPSGKEPFSMWELHGSWFPDLRWDDEPIELVIKGEVMSALDDVLDNWVHGGDEDYILAEFEEKLNKK